MKSIYENGIDHYGEYLIFDNESMVEEYRKAKLQRLLRKL